MMGIRICENKNLGGLQFVILRDKTRYLDILCGDNLHYIHSGKSIFCGKKKRKLLAMTKQLLWRWPSGASVRGSKGGFRRAILDLEIPPYQVQNFLQGHILKTNVCSNFV